ncbi:MAG TPA: hypothetical protein VEK11_17940 [Thermoanaerobaculia bacterium]|jgi:hypothetical protein|nr:hypothetical protein [Thermoanaerobaculia bacterium]
MSRRLRVIGLLLLLTLGATSLFGNPDYEVYYDYYSDAARTQWCGYWYITCTGMVRGGCVTDYVEVSYGPICFP